MQVARTIPKPEEMESCFDIQSIQQVTKSWSWSNFRITSYSGLGPGWQSGWQGDNFDEGSFGRGMV